MKRRLMLLIENVGESTTACLLAMVQGNVVALTASHWLIASRTGIVAGLVATAVLFAIQKLNKWIIAGTLAIITSVVDFFSHPAQFGPFATEAIVTGFAAGLLSLLVAKVGRGRPARRQENAERTPAG
jgi:hypothetical protein